MSFAGSATRQGARRGCTPSLLLRICRSALTLFFMIPPVASSVLLREEGGGGEGGLDALRGAHPETAMLAEKLEAAAPKEVDQPAGATPAQELSAHEG